MWLTQKKVKKEEEKQRTNGINKTQVPMVELKPIKTKFY